MTTATDETEGVTGFMCMIAWEHELGFASDGTKIYPSLEALKRRHPMWAECGVVEVKTAFVREAVPENLDRERRRPA